MCNFLWIPVKFSFLRPNIFLNNCVCYPSSVSKTKLPIHENTSIPLISMYLNIILIFRFWSTTRYSSTDISPKIMRVFLTHDHTYMQAPGTGNLDTTSRCFLHSTPRLLYLFGKIPDTHFIEDCIDSRFFLCILSGQEESHSLWRERQPRRFDSKPLTRLS